MKKYFCDICGAEIAGKPEFAPGLGNKIASDIWSMLACRKVLMHTWRKVGRALGVPDSDTER